MKITKETARTAIANLEKKFGFDTHNGTAQLPKLVKRYMKENGSSEDEAKIEVYSAYGELGIYESIAFE